MDNIPEKIDSKFRFVLLAAGRAEQLIRGARARVEAGTTKSAHVAMAEVVQDKIAWDYGPAPEPEGVEGEEAEAKSSADVH